MTPEEFYKKEAYAEYDKFDKSIAKFDYYFLMQFAEDYHKAATENCLLHSVSYCECTYRTDNWYDPDGNNYCFDCEKVIDESCS